MLKVLLCDCSRQEFELEAVQKKLESVGIACRKLYGPLENLPCGMGAIRLVACCWGVTDVLDNYAKDFRRDENDSG